MQASVEPRFSRSGFNGIRSAPLPFRERVLVYDGSLHPVFGLLRLSGRHSPGFRLVAALLAEVLLVTLSPEKAIIISQTVVVITLPKSSSVGVPADYAAWPASTDNFCRRWCRQWKCTVLLSLAPAQSVMVVQQLRVTKGNACGEYFARCQTHWYYFPGQGGGPRSCAIVTGRLFTPHCQN